MKICFDTFGCRLNRAESLEEQALYISQGHEIVKNHADSDIIILRGCSVTGRAQRDCERLISHIKKKYPLKKLVVQGCLPRNLLTRNPLPKTADGKAPLPTSTARAYLKIQDGCNSKCTYCTIPKFRGPSVSCDFEQTLDKAKRFIDLGYSEIVVTGCNVSQYNSNSVRLPQLLSSLAHLSPDCRIRLGSLEPSPCASETVDVISENDNICNFLHLSVQSGSNVILNAMGRKYSAADITKLCCKANEKMPLISIGADIICGFPGESEYDFAATRRLLADNPFTNVHAFPYSERPGTAAAIFSLQLPKEVRTSRARIISSEMEEKKKDYASKMKGRDVEVVIEDETKSSGWTAEYLWLESLDGISLKSQFKRKMLVKFKVVEVKENKLIGIAQNGRSN